MVYAKRKAAVQFEHNCFSANKHNKLLQLLKFFQQSKEKEHDLTSCVRGYEVTLTTTGSVMCYQTTLKPTMKVNGI